jgi:hypothetical protein
MKGSAIVIIGVGRHGVGRDNSFAHTSSPLRRAERANSLKVSIWCPCPESNEGSI